MQTPADTTTNHRMVNTSEEGSGGRGKMTKTVALEERPILIPHSGEEDMGQSEEAPYPNYTQTSF